MTTLTPDRNGTLMLFGYGVAIKVEAGHLILEGGVGKDRVYARIHKVTSGLKRLVLMGHDGYLTVDALLWLQGADAELLVFDRDCDLLFTSVVTSYQNVKLRRAQAIAAYTDTGLVVTKFQLEAKLRAQASTLIWLEDHGHQTLESSNAKAAILASADGIGRINDLAALRQVEARAAAKYWPALAWVPIQWAPGSRIPDHWRFIGGRESLTTGKHRPAKAISPAHAALNYLYALLTAEARFSCLAAGMDPGLGVLHADHERRPSMAHDLMEPVRPLVDRWLLEQLLTRRFTTRDFKETREGVTRLSPALCAELAATVPLWRQELRPFLVATAGLLLEGEGLQAAHSVSSRCLNRSCGKPLARGQKTYCSRACQQSVRRAA